MTAHKTARSVSRLALYGALASLAGVIASACGSTEEKLKVARLSEGCSLDSQCDRDLVCIFGRCHRECDEDEDCKEPGQRCVKGDADTNVCQLPIDTTCERDKDCEGDQICAADAECHDACTSSNDCIADQVCVPAGACASSDPTRDQLDAMGNLVTKKVDGGVSGAGGAGGGGKTGSGGQATGPDASAGGASSGGESGSGGEEGTGGEEGSGGSSGTGGAGTGGQAPDSGITCSGSGLDRFRPSNLPQGYTVPSAAPAYTHTNANCIFDTDDVVGPPLQGPHFTCAAAANVTSPAVVTLSDGREAAVLPLASLTIPTGVTLKIAGQRPVIIAVNGDVAIHGTIIGATGAVTKWVAGGATWRTSPYLSGLCPIDTVAGGGGGARSNDESSGAGGGFCGKGGNSTPANASIVLGGVTYGTENLVPLVGGSSGGMGSVATTSGPAGGGAVQIVSGSSILLGDTAVINMGGWASNEASKSRGGGGGSGGAILLEAPNITVRGVLAANGAAGSSGYLSHPQSGLAVSEAAICTKGNGANGAAGDTASGSDGPAGGGGGAGRIRINTGCGGTITIGPTAIISPSEPSGCYTRGELK